MCDMGKSKKKIKKIYSSRFIKKKSQKKFLKMNGHVRSRTGLQKQNKKVTRVLNTGFNPKIRRC